jgi:RHS repeat-associated protein
MLPASYRSYGAASTGSDFNMFATYPEINGGMYYADQRMYNPQMGKFFSPDPGGRRAAKRGKPLTWNRYLYANGDPINAFDPAGMYACDPGDDGECGGENEMTDCQDCDEGPDDDSGGTIPLYSVNSCPADQVWYDNSNSPGGGYCDKPVYGSNRGSGTEIMSQGVANTGGFVNFLGDIMINGGFLLATGMTVGEPLQTIGTTPVTVVHYTNASTADLVMESGKLRAGSYVTTPIQIPAGSTAGDIESILEIDPGKGERMLTGQSTLNNLKTPSNGPTTSGGAIQFQITRPISVAPPTRMGQ